MPRWTSAKAGKALRTREAEVAGVEVDAGGDVVDEDPDVDGRRHRAWLVLSVGRATSSATSRSMRVLELVGDGSEGAGSVAVVGVAVGGRVGDAPVRRRTGTPGNSGQTSRTLSQSVMTRSKRVRAKLPQVLGGVAGDVDAPLGHHPHRVGVERLGVAAGAAGVDGVTGALDRGGPRRSATGRCCRCRGTGPGSGGGARRRLGRRRRRGRAERRGAGRRRLRRAGRGSGARSAR